MRTRVAVAVVLMAFKGAAGWAQSKTVEGNWRTPTGSVVQVHECSGGVCLKLLQIERSAPGTEDRNNPDPKLRSRSLCGLEMGMGFRVMDQGRKAEGGTLYDPKSGRTYSGSLLAEGDTLHLRGYVGLKLFGRTEDWHRVEGAVGSCH